MNSFPAEIKHPNSAYILALAKLLERGAYYGVRALLTTHMVKSLYMKEDDALLFYSIALSCVYGTQVFGALIGDLILGNKYAAIFGGAIMANGMIALAIPGNLPFYIGTALIVLGTGFFTPNLMAAYVKSYSGSKTLLDSGFTMFYTCLNVGAFIGTAALLWLSDIDPRISFATAGIMMILATCIVAIHRSSSVEIKTVPNSKNDTKNALIVLSMIAMAGIFWFIYMLSGVGRNAIESSIFHLNTTMIYNILMYVEPFLAISTGVIASIVWSFLSVGKVVKFIIGFALLALSCILFIGLTLDSDYSEFVYFVAIVVLSISEILIAPIVMSTIARYGDPKYLAIFFSLSFLPMGVILALPIVKNFCASFDPGVSLIASIILSGLTAVGLVVFLIVRNQKRIVID
ncbi:MAG: MFS transporter [Flavobacterium sp.]|uniref:MFS transporter n=1 Tax=Flavobacterium sp. TaxID=239 RepID=UPI00121F6E7C|nr:MFS transporter [Flavobacterium sp.]RZJ67473.1 MAG: MFS transporter [Flavobacterium sp.]